MPQENSFAFPQYLAKRLSDDAAEPMEAAEFLALARAAWVYVDGQTFESFAQRARAREVAFADHAKVFQGAAASRQEMASLRQARREAKLDAEFYMQVHVRRRTAAGASRSELAALAEAERRAGRRAQESADRHARLHAAVSHAMVRLVARYRRGELTDEDCERLHFSVFIGLAMARRADPECLRLAYVDSRGGVRGGRLLLLLRVHKVFECLWFRVLCSLLIASLAACTAQRLPGQCRLAFGLRASKDPAWYERRGIQTSLSRRTGVDESAAVVDRALRAQGFRVARRRGTGLATLEAARGWLGGLGRLWWPLGKLAGLGRLGSAIVHLGVALIVIGGFISGLLAFRHRQETQRDDVIAVPDVSYHFSPRDQLARVWREARKLFLPMHEPAATGEPDEAAADTDWRLGQGPEPQRPAFRLRVGRFEARHDLSGKPEYYGAHVSVLDADPPLTHTIEVNDPLVYRGFHVYLGGPGNDYRHAETVSFLIEQPERGDDTSRLLVTAALERELLVPGTGLTLHVLRYFPDFTPEAPAWPDGQPGRWDPLTPAGQPRNPYIELRMEAPGLPPFRQYVPLPGPDGSRPPSVEYGGFRITPKSFGPAQAVSLTFKAQPVLLPVWIGCGVMMLGIVLCFYCNHERVWALVQVRDDGGSDVFLAANAFKWRQRLRDRLRTVAGALREDEDPDA